MRCSDSSLRIKKYRRTVIAAISVEPEVVSGLVSTVRALPVTSEMIQEATAADPILQKVLHFHSTSWPNICTDQKFQPFFQQRSSLSEIDGILLFAERVVPFELVKSCTKCQLVAKSPRKTTLYSWPTPESPWSRLHIDFAGPINGQHYLILVDAYSKWPEVFHMNHPTSTETVKKLQEIFSRFGTPEILVSDNGTAEFSEFNKKNSIQHLRSPPFHPQSNGQAERFVDMFKRALLKLKGEGSTQEIIDIFLSSYRATPNPNCPNVKSPAEALMNRKIRLPIDIICPLPSNSLKRNKTMERQFNHRHGAVSRQFLPGQPVWAKDYRNGKEKWTQGYIILRSGNVIYDVDVQSTTWVRHANQLHHSYLPERQSNDTVIPLNVLLDTFELPQSVQTKCSKESKSQKKLPTRRTQRKGKPTSSLQVDPQQSSYDYHTSKEGVGRNIKGDNSKVL